MASLSFSNLVKNTASTTKPSPYKSFQTSTTPYLSLSPNPLNSALTSKMTQVPLSPIQPKLNTSGGITGSNLNDAVSKLNSTLGPIASKPSIPGVKTASAYEGSIQPTIQSQPQQSTGTDLYKQMLIQNIQSQLADKQSQLKNLQSEEKKQQETPQPSPLFSSFLTKGQEALGESAALGEEAGNLRRLMQQQTMSVMGNPWYSGGVRIGQSGLIQQNLGSQLEGLSAQQSALQQLGQSYLSGAGVAAPVQVPYGNQFLDPTTGQPIGGGAAGGTLQSAVGNIAQKIQNGTMGYDQGVQALGAYGQAGVNALQQILGPQFDIVGSNARAAANAANIEQTGTTGGQIQKAADSAIQALNTLQSAYNTLGSFTGGSNVPIFNQISQNIAMSTGLGREAVSGYQGALKEARAQINAVLAPIVGVESANATSNSLLPDNMIPSEIPKKIAAAVEYINQRVAAFTQANPLGQTSGSGGGSLYDF